MSARILGVSAFYHDSAAALVIDGRLVAAAQEERFTRIKHDPSFPLHAVDYCLREGGISRGELDYVAFYDTPRAKFDRLVETHVAHAPFGLGTFRQAMRRWMTSKLHLPRELDRALRGEFGGQYVFADHHESHAASAFFASPFEEAAILTLDGVGEWSTTTMGTGRGHRIALTHELRFPHSLGLLYSAMTQYTGFRVNSGEYKVMGLAPYGRPIYRDRILEHLIDLKDDGSFWIDLAYFDFAVGRRMTNTRFHRLFGGPPRSPEAPITQREMDLAASVQVVCEEVMLRCARHLHARTGLPKLVMAGGVALNCVGNGRILREGPFDDLWIQPASGDAGGALGAAWLTWHHVLGQPRTVSAPDGQHGSLLGPRYGDEEIRRCLDRANAVYRAFDSEDELVAHVAELLAQELVVGWFQGRMEFGPRALGARSILGDPRSAHMQATMNLKIKFRESFRPFAPIVLAEEAHRWFEMPPGRDSPYMLLVAPVLETHRVSVSPELRATMEHDPDLRNRVNVVRSTIPAVTHVDHSARLQTVDRARNPRLHHLLSAFHARTGCPVLVNTSFNVRGEPIVCTPDDAYRCFLGTNMDVLVLENVVLRRVEQVAAPGFDAESYRSSFSLD